MNKKKKKRKLFAMIRPNKNSVYGINDIVGVGHLSKLRLQFSRLNEHRFRQVKAQILTGSQSTRKSSNLTKISQWHRRFKPPETKSIVCDEVSSTLTKIEMDAQILQLFNMFFDKSVAEISVQSCLYV